MGIQATFEWVTRNKAFTNAWRRRWLAFQRVADFFAQLAQFFAGIIGEPLRKMLLFTIRPIERRPARIVMTEDIMVLLWKQVGVTTPYNLYMRVMTTVLSHASSVPIGHLDRYYVLVDKLSVSNHGKRRDRSHITPYAPGTRITERGVSEPHATCYDELNMPRIMCNPYLACMVFRFFLVYMATDPRLYHLPMAFDYDDGLFYIDRGVVRWIRSRDYRIREADLRLVALLLSYRRTHACIMWSLDSDELILGTPFGMDFKHGFFWATEYMDRNESERKRAMGLCEWYVQNFTRIDVIATPEEDDANQRLTSHILHGTPLVPANDEEEEEEEEEEEKEEEEEEEETRKKKKKKKTGNETYTIRLDAVVSYDDEDTNETVDGLPRIAMHPMDICLRKTTSDTSSSATATALVPHMKTEDHETVTKSFNRKRSRAQFDSAYDEIDQPFASIESYPAYLPPLMFNMREFRNCLRPIMSTEAFLFFGLVNGSDWISHDELFYRIPSEDVRIGIVETIDVEKRNPVRHRLDFDYVVQRIWSKRLKSPEIMSMNALHKRWKNSRIPQIKAMDELHDVVKIRYPYWRTLQNVVPDTKRDKLLDPEGAPTTDELEDMDIHPASNEPDLHMTPIIRSEVAYLERN